MKETIVRPSLDIEHLLRLQSDFRCRSSVVWGEIDYSGIITTTGCALLILIVITLFLRINRFEMKEFREFFQGIIAASLQELRFKGGRAARANIVLSVVLALLFVHIVVGLGIWGVHTADDWFAWCVHCEVFIR
jgi:hypothetical protein